jgi:RNA polymerase sigma factor (sigma-70 family)
MPQHREELIPTRASLIRRLKDWQDQPSWEEFFQTYWKLIYGVARKADLSDAESQDVVQETMASVAKHMPTFRYDPAIGSFKAWLLNLTRWRIIDQLRKRGPLMEKRSLSVDSGRETDPLENMVDPASLRLDDWWDAEWENNLLEAASAKVRRRIEPQKYQVFDFYVNKAWPPEKVAERFHVSIDQVYVIKSRVTEAIRTEVKRLQEGVT